MATEERLIVFENVSRTEHGSLQNDDRTFVDVFLKRIAQQFQSIVEFRLGLNRLIKELRNPYASDGYLLIGAN